jgi:hypothetical protein
MLQWLNSHISLTSLIWLFPLTFMLHDFEEIIFVERFFAKRYETLRQRVPERVRNVLQSYSGTTCAQFSFVVLLELLLFIPTTYAAAEYEIYMPFVGFNLVLLLHVFTHLGQSLYVRMYTLGVGTAIFITLPYSLYILYRLLYKNIIHTNLLLPSFFIGLTLLPVVIAGHEIAKKLLP